MTARRGLPRHLLPGNVVKWKEAGMESEGPGLSSGSASGVLLRDPGMMPPGTTVKGNGGNGQDQGV